MPYAPVVHLHSVYARGLDLTIQLPWLYIIALRKRGLLYIGETYDSGGLVSRIGAHFGPYVGSTLKRRIEEISGVRRIAGSVLITAARLPFGEDAARLDATSKQVRLAIEAKVHEKLATKFLPEHPRWAIVSTPQPPAIAQTSTIDEVADEIARSFGVALSFTDELSNVTPFHLILLERTASDITLDESSVGDQIEQIEVLVFNFVISKLRDQFGERWWTEGVPGPVRRQCAERREEEGTFETVPPHAYLTLVNIKEILNKNWPLFQNVCERLSAQRGKDRATKWIDDLNEVRKQWAHPVKKLFVPIQAVSLRSVQELHGKVSENFKL